MDGARVIIHDPSSNEARQERLEKACIRFMQNVYQQKKKELAATSSNSKKQNL